MVLKQKKKDQLNHQKLLNLGFTNFDLIEIAKNDSSITSIDVWLGNKEKIKVYLNQDIYKTVPKARKKYLKAKIELQWSSTRHQYKK